MKDLKPILDQLFTQKVPNSIRQESEIFKNAEIRDSHLPLENELRSIFGKEGEPFSTEIGIHPDFKDLGSNTKYQYMCSVFLDISGSTKLGLKFPLETVILYKNAILRSAIEIFQVFDGHIHRLQGDAVFAYFGHSNMKKSDAVINALNAASIMQIYNKLTLSEFFIQNGLEPLKIRIGIDVGDEHQVLWGAYGLNQTSEVTSTSIHTDLAAKLQSKAPRNAINIGENVYNYLDLPIEFLDKKLKVTNGIEEEEKYILRDSSLQKYYQMRIFNWEKYIKSFSFLPEQQNTLYKAPNDFEIISQCSEDGETIIPIKRNVRALPKESALGFKLVLKNHARLLKPTKIEWRVINRGTEAKESDSENFVMEEFSNKYTCEQSTAYNGHHYMQCSLYNERGKLIGRDKFGLYVNDETNSMKDLGIANLQE